MAMIGNHSPPRFPSYLLDHVFVHLPLADLYACQRVCQEWRSAISYYPSLRPKLFTAPPVQTTTRPCKQPLNTAADVQLHPVFTAIEQDWSIILSTAVFSRSDTRNPKALQNFAVRDNMATYPAVKQVSIWVQIDGVYTPTGRARRGGSETGERRFETKVEREAGVRVGDTWDTFMELMANTRGIGPKDRTLRETFMTGQYHSFTWGIGHVPPTSSISLNTITSTNTASGTSTSAALNGDHRPTTTSGVGKETWFLKKTFYGIAYRGHFDEELALERAEYAEKLISEMFTSAVPTSQNIPQNIGSGAFKNGHGAHGGNCNASSLSSETTDLAKKKTHRRRNSRLWGSGEARRYEGEFDCMSF